MLPDGLSAIPAGKVAAVVTHLEMRTPPEYAVARPFASVSIRRVENPEPGWYRTLFRRIGADWLWFSRLLLDDTALAAILQSPEVDVFTVESGGPDRGMAELDRRGFPEIEVAFFGLAPELIGRGVGAWLMSVALETAWSHQPNRVTVHTCTLDHPGALSFYRRCGFVPYRRSIEIADDPRLMGILPRTSAPHIPIIE